LIILQSMPLWHLLSLLFVHICKFGIDGIYFDLILILALNLNHIAVNTIKTNGVKNDTIKPQTRTNKNI